MLNTSGDLPITSLSNLGKRAFFNVDGSGTAPGTDYCHYDAASAQV